jgi:hypothetical protein
VARSAAHEWFRTKTGAEVVSLTIIASSSKSFESRADVSRASASTLAGSVGSDAGGGDGSADFSVSVLAPVSIVPEKSSASRDAGFSGDSSSPGST